MEKEEGKTYPVADVDDTVGFMTAARAYTSQQASQVSAATIEDTIGEQKGFSNASDDFAGDSTLNEFVTASTSDDAYPSNNFLSRNDSGFGDYGKDITNPFVSDFDENVEVPKPSAIGLPGDVAEFVSKNGIIEASPAAAAGTSDPAPLEEEENQDRENLATFKTWGTPVARDKPAARVRRIIIKGLPSSWSTPSKVLSLIHGGIIESISITPSGNAHVLFAEPEACKAFYDKYPNGIDLDKDKRYTVFVEMGEEVDVVSSQLSYNLSVGATRVIRSVGVDMNITMGQLLKISTANNRKVEKILESYVPGEARNITFRFCSIVEAVGFRGLINRDADWEHCNIQYAPDPCEIATEFHAD